MPISLLCDFFQRAPMGQVSQCHPHSVFSFFTGDIIAHNAEIARVRKIFWVLFRTGVFSAVRHCPFWLKSGKKRDNPGFSRQQKSAPRGALQAVGCAGRFRFYTKKHAPPFAAPAAKHSFAASRHFPCQGNHRRDFRRPDTVFCPQFFLLKICMMSVKSSSSGGCSAC